MLGKNPYKIWYLGHLWTVVKRFTPTEFDEYLLVQRQIEDKMVMVLIDTGNDEFYPNTEKAIAILEKQNNL